MADQSYLSVVLPKHLYWLIWPG